MDNFSLIDKFKILMNVILSSPLFLTFFMVCIALIIFFIVYIKKGIKINKWLFIGIWGVFGLILIFSYNSIVFDLVEDLINNIFITLYFPNLTIYLLILIISNFFFIYSLFNKKVKNSYKIVNIFSSLILNTFLFIIVSIVKRNEINIHDTLTIYSNSNLLVLLELSSAIFVSWILINLLLTAYYKLQKYDEKTSTDLPEIVFDN